MLPGFVFHHIGIAVYDIESTARYYIDAGYKKSESIYDPVQNVQICFLLKEGMPKIELLAPRDNTSPVSTILEKNGVSPYHICYEVNNLESAISDLRQLKYLLVKRPEYACAIDNRRVCFMFNKSVGLIELLEK
jgi:methylmalonyl-CoA/ethylmalonyl-CoA epimerase